ncbi:aspartate kinase [Candidatus Chlamydia sanziniae]|uniref:Aspartokinase n=1 Tax=Candidatus Chlamydia sanziniae TaxID=1806891 RepID=A0A1A9HWM8_9CHLA|nr:aspartate kinase [Candidatus Chlamydia sanziniae]ANH78841.1 Aspartokinase [Candidatus Chlamydia sanziniae]
MPHVVYKFGGTNLATAENIQTVCDIICADKPNFVVVSAIAGMTDLLDRFCSVSLEERPRLLQEFKDKHEQIIKELGIPFSLLSWMSRLTRYLQQPWLSALDSASILALGEDLSASLVHTVCHIRGLALGFLEARSIILTDDHYNCATPDVIRMQKKWHHLRLYQECYITQGFIGASRSGDTTLLGRGGSDYTAALIAEMCGAYEVRIYTDVNGIYTMDPKIIEDAQQIPELSFEEMKNLATFGAKVLYPPMLAPCIRAGIPIFVTSTFDPIKGGTWIYAMDKTIRDEPCVKALSLRQHQSFCSIDYSLLGHRGLDEVLRILESYEILPELMTAQGNVVTFIIDDALISKEAQEHLVAVLSSFSLIRLYHDLALVTMIGDGLSSPKVVSTITEKLYNLPWPILCCCQSQMSLSFVVSAELAEDIVQQFHNDYVKQNILVV